MNIEEKETLILESLQNEKAHQQRDLARLAGTSLGMTNAILRRLAEKGLVMIKKINNRNIKYIVSAAGIEEISRRSFRYIKRTFRNVAYYKDAVQQLIDSAGAQGYSQICLLGESDISFIFEHCCDRSGMELIRSLSGIDCSKTLIVLSESYEGIEVASAIKLQTLFD